MIYAAAAFAILIALAITLVRAWRGPTVFDRILAGNTIGTLAVALIAVYDFLSGGQGLLDIAILYALLNVLSTLAILKFSKFGGRDEPNSDDNHKQDALS